MANEIDRRILDLQFNNSQFESGVNQSIGTLDRLKNALSFKGVEKGIEKLSFSPISSGLSAVTMGFTKMEAIAFGALQKIGAEVVVLGKRLINNLFAQPKAGWSKYNEITSSVQTILDATKELGQTMETVTGYVNRLNWYTDETSYSLTDMTNNIAKFTSAGIELDSATVAMIGIANASALAGSGIQSASHAMAGFSKAMSAGYMGTRQWMWIETAKLDTMAFKNELIKAAEQLGVLKKVTSGSHAGEYITTGKGGAKKGKYVTAENIRENLSAQWLNKDVMEAALNTYGRFANIMGDFYTLMGDGAYYTTNELLAFVDEYAKGTLDIQKLSKKTGVSVETLMDQFEALKTEGISGIDANGELIYTIGRNAFAAAQEAITLRQAWDALTDALSTGWMKTWQLIFGNYEEAKKLWTNLANWLYDLFAEGGNVRNAILEEWHFSESGGYEDFINSLYNIMDAVTSVRDIIKEVFDQYLPSIDADTLINWTDKLLSYTTSLKSYMDQIKERFEYIARITGRSTEEETSTVFQDGLSLDPDKTWRDYMDAGDYANAYALAALELKTAKEREAAEKEIAKAKSKAEKDAAKAESDRVKREKSERESYEKWLKKQQAKYGSVDPSSYWDERGGMPDWFIEETGYAAVTTRSHSGAIPKPDSNLMSVAEILATDAAISNLYDGLDGLNSILDILKETATSAWGALKQIFSPAKILVDDIVKLFGALGRRLVEIGDKLVGEGKISAFFDNLADKASGPVEKVVDFLHRFLEALIALIDPEVSSGTSEFVASIKELLGGLWTGIQQVAEHVLPVLSNIWKVFKSIIGAIGDMISGFIGKIDWTNFPAKLKAFFDVGIAALFYKLSKNLAGISEKFKGKGVVDIVKEVFFGAKDAEKEEGGLFDGFVKVFEKFTTSLSASIDKFLDVNALKSFAASLLMIAAAMMIIALIPGDKLIQVALLIGGVIGAFSLLMKQMSGFKAVKTKELTGSLDAKAILAIGVAIAALAGAILVIAVSLAILALIPQAALEKAIGGLLVSLLIFIGALAGMMYLIEKMQITPQKILALSVAFIAAAAAILIISAAIVVLAVALGIMALIPADKLLSGALAIIAIMVVMGVLMYGLSDQALGIIAVAAAFLVLSASVAVLALSLGLLALIPANKLQAGVIALTVLMAVLGLLTLGLSSNALGIMAVAAAFLILAPALLIMSLALIALSLVPFMKLLGGLVVFAAMLAVISAAAIVASVMIGPLFALGGALILIGAGTILLGAGLVLVSTAITILIVGVSYGIATIIDSIANLVAVIVGPFEGIGKSVTKFKERLVNGLKNILPKLKEVGKELWDKLVNAWESIDFKAIGQNIIDGIKNGLKKCWEGIKSAGKWLWDTLTSGFNAAGGISSPSKVMMDEMKWVVAGMAIGADKNERSIRAVGAGMAEALLGATGDALQNYDDFAPNLSPVLDLSNVSGSAGLTLGATLTPAASRSIATVSADIQNQKDSIGAYIDAAVQSAINGMRNELTFVVPLEVDGRQFARSTAKFTRDAQDLMDRNTLRKGGYV